MYHEVFLTVGMGIHIERIVVRIKEKKAGKINMFVSSLFTLMCLTSRTSFGSTPEWHSSSNG